MAKQNIDIGVEGNDGTGDSIRESFRKVNENFSELYAVFGIGGQISFTNLDDVPNTYVGNENKIPVVRQTATGMNFLELASNNALDGSIDTVGFDFSVEGKLIVRTLATTVANDPEPALGGPLNAAGQPIAGVEITTDAVNRINSVHGTNYTIGDLLINKAYGDQNYQQKSVLGSGIRVGDEPADVLDYSLSTTVIDLGNLVIPGHDINPAQNGAPYVFNSSGTDPDNVTSGETYYIRIVDSDTISLHSTQQGALDNTGRLILSGGSGTFTITDAAYDPSLPGNWLSNQVLPRYATVRRQGDRMEGALTLHDHPGDLSGAGTPNGPDDLQAATKYYVDSATAISTVDLYVSTSGSDRQESSLEGRQGRSMAYAYRTIGAAAQGAEELSIASTTEPGPFMQTMTHSNGAENSEVQQAGISTPFATREDAQQLINLNFEFIYREVFGFVEDSYPQFAQTYDIDRWEEDLRVVLDSVVLDSLVGNNANFLTIRAGYRYFSEPAARLAASTSLPALLAGLDYARTLVLSYILTNTQVPTSYQDKVSQVIEQSLAPSSQDINTIQSRLNTVLGIVESGVLAAPPIVDGVTTYKLYAGNGNFGNVDQATPLSSDIIPGKVIRGRRSGAVGRIITYTQESELDTVTVPSADEIELQLLVPIEFEEGEELEYGNAVQSVQVTIHVETGTYEEDFPIKVPDNVSIVSSDPRRTIVRPKNRVSQSRWSDIYFYRDTVIDDVIVGRSDISEVQFNAQTDSNRAPGTYVVDTFTTNGQGSGAEFEIEIDSNGSVVNVEILNGGTAFQEGDSITISDSQLGSGGATSVVIVVDKVPNGLSYVDPLSDRVKGHFGYHYLTNPAEQENTGEGYTNIGNWEQSALILKTNREFIKEQVRFFAEDQYPTEMGAASNSTLELFDCQIGFIVDSLIKDLRAGGNEFVLEAQGEFYETAFAAGIDEAAQAGIEYIFTIASRLLNGEAPVILYGDPQDRTQEADLYYGAVEIQIWQSNTQYVAGDIVRFLLAGVYNYYRARNTHTSGSTFNMTEIISHWIQINGPEQTVENLVNTVAFAYDASYNPPLRNTEIDAFLFNDATGLVNLSIQGHGGFVAVLDPEGQIATKPPRIESCISYSQSLNRQAIRGGIYVDAFAGNIPVKVVERINNNPFRLLVESDGSESEPQGLFVRRPQSPCPFYIDGQRFQINSIVQYTQSTGTAELILDPSSNNGQGFIGQTSQQATGVNLTDLSSPIGITIQTAGSRTIEGINFPQINDLGYGVFAVNGGEVEITGVPTQYCWASYLAKDGGQIRSQSGATAFGNFGLIAQGSDPNEIPDIMNLAVDMVQPARTFVAARILKLAGPVELEEGDEIRQVNSLATGTVAIGTGPNGSNIIYLEEAADTFNTVDELEVITDSTNTPLGPDSVPYAIDNTMYVNSTDSLFVHVFDMQDVPANNSEIDIYHAGTDQFARYEIANVELTTAYVDRIERVNDIIPASQSGTGTGAVFNIAKTISGGYSVEIVEAGEDYSIGDTFTVSGQYLGGVDSANDAVITVNDISSGGAISEVEITGTIEVTPYTPVYSGRVYRLNFSTGDAQFIATGLLDSVFWGDVINYRRNRAFLLDDVSESNRTSIRPSTAIVFNEDTSLVYRSNSFVTSNSIGEELEETQAQALFDSNFNYISLTVSIIHAQTSENSGSGITKGATPGDNVIAVEPFLTQADINRLNNNIETPEANRPVNWTVETLVQRPIIVWGGKKHYVYNYRGVDSNGNIVAPAEDNAYGIVSIEDTTDSIVSSGPGLASSVVLGSQVVVLRAGLASGAIGDITSSISACRASGHEFSNVGTGGYNDSNFPNVLYGPAAERAQNTEVVERGKGRVFYTSTDQDGTFRVGRFFAVNQGTGSVTFSAQIALSDVDGLGFKRGVVVSEFSTDTAMSDNSADAVPTESAVRGYVNRRLGFDVNGNLLANSLGPTALSPTGIVPLSGNLNANGNTITNLRGPQSDAEAATKQYVDLSQNNVNEVRKLRSVAYNNVGQGDLLVSTQYKKILSRTTTVSGTFEVGTTITGNTTSATGTVVDVRPYTDTLEGSVIEITYTPVSGTISGNETVTASNGATGAVSAGPIDVWANGKLTTDSNLTITTNRELTISGGNIVDRRTDMSIKIKSNSISNSMVASNAAIAQSKLNLQAATTRSSASGITQADRGVASFDSAVFASTNGWITINNGGMPTAKVQRLSDNTVLGNSAGDGVTNARQVPFSTVVDLGNGLQDSEFTTVVPAGSPAGQALVKTGTSTYGVSNISTSGAGNSIVKTKASGAVQANSLIIGGDDTYEVLSLNVTELVFKTPAQGVILRAVGGSSTVAPDVRIPGNVNIDGTGITNSSIKNSSILANRKALAASWMYSSFIEAPGERGAASTGIAIGANTGFTTARQVAIITGDTGTNSSLAPAIFSSTGMLPDIDDNYDIGSASRKYANVYATLFRGTATESYYADLAENYLADDQYVPGTVLAFGGEYEVTTVSSKGSHKVAGVVSTNPAHLMNSELTGDNVVALALQGRVPCKVVGKVEKGDLLVSSAIPGYAVVDNNPRVGTVIGKALENKTTNDKGVVEIVVGKH